MATAQQRLTGKQKKERIAKIYQEINELRTELAFVRQAIKHTYEWRAYNEIDPAVHNRIVELINHREYLFELINAIRRGEY